MTTTHTTKIIDLAARRREAAAEAEAEGYGLNSYCADALVDALGRLVEAMPETVEAKESLGWFVHLLNHHYLGQHGWQLDYTPGETIATEGA
jgi:hypothetical protein